MESLDLTGLKPEEVALVKEFLEFLKTRSAAAQTRERAIEYHRWPLGVKEEITRKEVYDYL